MPIYRIEATIAAKNAEKVTETRLVQAANMATAMRHAGKEFFAVAVCTTAEAIELGAKGIKLEEAE